MQVMFLEVLLVGREVIHQGKTVGFVNNNTVYKEIVDMQDEIKENMIGVIQYLDSEKNK